MSDSQRPHGLQPTRFLRPWDLPGKSTGVGCHCLLPVTIFIGTLQIITGPNLQTQNTVAVHTKFHGYLFYATMPNDFWVRVTESLLLIPQFRILELGLKMVPLDRTRKRNVVFICGTQYHRDISNVQWLVRKSLEMLAILRLQSLDSKYILYHWAYFLSSYK